MIITFPPKPDADGEAQTGAQMRAAVRSDQPSDPTVMRPVPGYDVTCIEASARVRDGLCPLCAQPARGLAVTCGDSDCVLFVGDMPPDYVWVLQESRALHASALSPDVTEIGWSAALLALLAAGATGGLLTVLAFWVGVWLDVLQIRA